MGGGSVRGLAMADEGCLSAQKPIVINVTAVTTAPKVRSRTQERRVFMGVLNFLFNPEDGRASPGWPEYSQSSPRMLESNFSTTAATYERHYPDCRSIAFR